MFADNAKIYRAVNCIEDVQTLQMDVDNMVQWSKKWQLPFNVKKCKCIHFGQANHIKQVYTMGNHKLETVTERKDIGVIIGNTFLQGNCRFFLDRVSIYRLAFIAEIHYITLHYITSTTNLKKENYLFLWLLKQGLFPPVVSCT